MSVFTITSKSIEEQVIDYGYFSITYKVAGYWSRDTIRIDGCRNHKEGWNVDVSHGFGGFDEKSDWTRLDAMRNFANTLLAATEMATEISSNTKNLNDCYKRHIDIINARAAEENAAEEARIAKELAIIEAKAAQEMEWTLDKTAAQQVISRIENGARNSYRTTFVKFRKAGHKKIESLFCSETANGKASYYLDTSRIAKRNALLKLEGSIVTACSV